MVAELIAARSDVPGFGNQLHARENRILAQRIEETGAGIEAIGLTSERGTEIETETVDME